MYYNAMPSQMQHIIFILLLLLSNSFVFSQTTIHMENESGVYLIPCKVNGLDLKFIFDTGASNVSISLTEALFMIKNGYLSERHIYGTTYARLANGDIAENTEILLKEIDIGGIKIYDIRASIVHELAAPLLLGQSAIQKLGSIQLEGNKLIILNAKSGGQESPDRNFTYRNQERDFNKPTTPRGANNASYAGIQLVYECSAILSEPDMNSKKIGQACDGQVTIISKVDEQFYKVKSNLTTGYIWVGNFINESNESYNKPLRTGDNVSTATGNKLQNNYEDYQEVYECSAIYDRPDMGGRKIGQACSGVVFVVSKASDKFYKVRSNTTVGYIWVGNFKD